MYNIVLAGDRNEGRAYQSRVGLNARNSRLATTAGSIRGLRVALIHELPGFKNRLDRHAINAELKYAEKYSERRGGNVARIFPDLLSYEEALEDAYSEPEVSVQVTVDSSQFDAGVEAALAEFEEAEQSGALERKRRSRCKTCGVLTLGADDPAHIAEAHEETKQPVTVSNFFGAP